MYISASRGDLDRIYRTLSAKLLGTGKGGWTRSPTGRFRTFQCTNGVGARPSLFANFPGLPMITDIMLEHKGFVS
jgi:hypothetical protein